MAIHLSIKGNVTNKSLQVELARKTMRTCGQGTQYITFSVMDNDTTYQDGKFVKGEGHAYRMIAYGKTAEEILKTVNGGQEVLFICDEKLLPATAKQPASAMYAIREFYPLRKAGERTLV